MKKNIILSLAIILMASCTACSGQKGETDNETQAAVDERSGQEETNNGENELSDSGGVSDMEGKSDAARIPPELAQIPEEYFTPAGEQGIIERLNYQTYESMSYENRTKQLEKTAYVYLPYGYTEEKQFPVFYLMHGGWSNETTYLGTPEHPNVLKNVIDHAIQEGKMEPMIVVCPTYNNESPDDSGDYGLALRLTDNYHNELVNDLIPAVEGNYRTYAEGTSPKELKESRDHRAFAGFSMGSVTTWHTFSVLYGLFPLFSAFQRQPDL